MNSDWRAFLETRSAAIDSVGHARFDSAPKEPDCAIIDLSQLGVIAVDGPDAGQFLQGQLSNDIRELTDTHSQLSSHCSPKGRMLANFRIVRTADRFLLVLPRTQVEPLLKRLRMFVLRAKVSIDDVSDLNVCCGIIGHCADAALGATFGALPAADNDMVQADDALLIRVAGDVPRFLWIGPAAQATALWQALVSEAGAVEADAHLWSLHDIRAGIPTVMPETTDAFVPQMTNMQLIDGVSFTKGCYTGQEVVARMQYLGKLKRRMYVAEVETDTAPRPGDVLSVRGSTSEQVPGRVVDAQAIAPGRYALLVVVEISAAEGGEVRLRDGGPVLSLRALPYDLPDLGE